MIEKLNAYAGFVSTALVLLAIMSRHFRKPWEKPIDDLDKAITAKQTELDKRVIKLELEQQSIVTTLSELKVMIQKQADDDKDRLDRLNEKVDKLLFQMANKGN